MHVSLDVEELPAARCAGAPRARFAVDRAVRPGLRPHRSRDVVVLQDCPITVEPAVEAVLDDGGNGAGAVDVAVDSVGG